jgi:hypothetical protein
MQVVLRPAANAASFNDADVVPSCRPLPAAATQPLLAMLKALAMFLRPPCSPAAIQALWSADVVRAWSEAIGPIFEVPTSPHLSPADCCPSAYFPPVHMQMCAVQQLAEQGWLLIKIVAPVQPVQEGVSMNS